MRKIIRAGLAVALLATGLLTGSATAATSCAGAAPGGDWATHGGEISGTRSQPDAQALNTSSVLNITAKWNFSVADAGGTGNVESIPIVSNGCVYIQTSTGWLYALNADDGALVWAYESAAGASFSSPTVVDGVVYLIVPSKVSPTTKGIHVVALNALTGAIVWDGETLAEEDIASANAGAMSSAVYFDGMIFVGLTSDELTMGYTGGYALVDAADGSLIKRVYSTPDEDMANGVGTCSIWSTPSIDPDGKKLYVGTGQPAGWFDTESEMCNAIIKVELDRNSPNFGEIIGSAKGIPDDLPYADVDFGSAPTLVRDAEGRLIVAQLQKAGYVTAAFTRHMTQAWRTPVSPAGILLGNYTPSASDGRNVFTVGAYPGQLYSLNGGTGVPNWVVPVGSPTASTSVAYANGVVYHNNEEGIISAHDATNGAPLFAHPIAVDNAQCVRNTAGGIAIARERLFAACGQVVAVYGL